MCLIVTLIYISLVTKDVTHHFPSLFTLCISPLFKCLFKYFTHLKIVLLVSLLSCKFYIPGISSLLDMWEVVFLLFCILLLFIFVCVGSLLLCAGFL